MVIADTKKGLCVKVDTEVVVGGIRAGEWQMHNRLLSSAWLSVDDSSFALFSVWSSVLAQVTSRHSVTVQLQATLQGFQLAM